MRITFRTNLDLGRQFLPFRMGETWDHVPAVGSLIDLPMHHNGQVLSLEVRHITYTVEGHATIDLHIPIHTGRSIAEWEKWMKSRLGQE